MLPKQPAACKHQETNLLKVPADLCQWGSCGAAEANWRSPAGWWAPSFPGSNLPGRSTALGQGRASVVQPGGALIQGHPSAHSSPSVRLPHSRNFNKGLTAPWYYFCEEWLCLECMKVRLATVLYPAIRACDTRPVTYYSNVLRFQKYFTEWLKRC